MEHLSDYGLLNVLLALFPGFLTAEIVSALVVRDERSTFDRTVRALIYTVLCHFLWFIIRSILRVGDAFNIIGLVISAVIVGLVITWIINSGKIHDLLRWIGLTQAVSRPNEWYDVFYDRQDYVVLHLRDGRRIFGWPRIYPFSGEKGHLLLEGAQWLDSKDAVENTDPKSRTDCMIPAVEIVFVEFVKPLSKELSHAK